MTQIINTLLATVAGLPPAGIYLAVLVWLTFESAGTPIPNEAILLYCGFLAGTGRISALIAVAMGVLGSLAGALISYAIGRYGGRAAVNRLGRFILLTPARLASAEGWFGRRGAATIFIARLTPVVRTLISYPAGLSRMPLRPFILSTLGGALIWCSLAVALGWWAGRNYTQLFDALHRLGPVAGLAVLVAVAAYFLLERRVKALLFD